MNNSVLRLEDTDDRLYGKDDSNGECVYFLDKECMQPFNGIVYGTNQGCIGNHKGWLEYEEEITNGYRNGIQVIYRENGSIEQISECKLNLLYGISKEYDEQNVLKSVSVVMNNSHIKIIELDYQGGYRVRTEKEANKLLTEYIKKLLDLPPEELFKHDLRSEYGLFEKIKNKYL